MVNPLETRLIKPTRLAHPGMLFQGHGLLLYSGNEKKHGYLRGSRKDAHMKGEVKSKENLQSIRNPKNAILYQRSPKIDENPNPLLFNAYAKITS